MKEKNILYHGLPAVFYRNKYIVFSPYSKKIITLNKEEIKDKNILKYLSTQKFFGKAKNNENDNNVIKFTFNLASGCNMRCIYCFEDCGKKQTLMDKNLALNILKQKIKTHKNAIFYIHFFGGEPTLNFSTIKAVVEFLKKSNIRTFYRINTNGILSEDRLEYMINNGFHFDVSCDGPPKIQNIQRPLINRRCSSAFVEKTIKYLINKKADLNVRTVITNYNYTKIPEIINYFSDIGLKKLRLEIVLGFGRASKKKLVPETKEFVKYFMEGLKIAKERKVFISNWSYRNLFNPSTYFCKTVKSNRLIILPNRKVSKCINNFIMLGNVDKNGIFKINKKRLKEARGYSVEKMPYCHNCFAKYICSGGCYYENFIATGDPLNPAKDKCELTKNLLTEIIIDLYKDNIIKKFKTT